MIVFFALLIGLAMGSFLNVVVLRTHQNIPLTGRSKCMVCENPIGARDLIPVVSYLALRGRCRSCKTAFSWQYPAVEAATALLFALIAWVKIPSVLDLPSALPLAARNMIFTLVLITIFVYDGRFQYILDRFTVPGMIIAVLFNLFFEFVPLSSMLLGALLCGGLFALQFVISKGQWIGDGDIRMGVMMGLMLGWQAGVLAVFLSYIIGAVIAAGILISKKKKQDARIAFGTFLAVGTFISMLWGQGIIEWYLGYLI